MGARAYYRLSLSFLTDVQGLFGEADGRGASKLQRIVASFASPYAANRRGGSLRWATDGKKSHNQRVGGSQGNRFEAALNTRMFASSF